KQYELLDEITGEVSRLATQLQGKDKAGNVANSPAHKVMWKLVHAAMLSHLPDTGRAALAEARTTQRDEVFDTLEALLGNASTQIEMVRQIGQWSDSDHGLSRIHVGASFFERRDKLRQELAKLKATQVTTGATDPAAVDRLTFEIDALRLDAELVAQIGA